VRRRLRKIAALETARLSERPNLPWLHGETDEEPV
jgi:hypothetical protein